MLDNFESKTDPLISIIVLNYNAGKLLENCIDSIFKSNLENYEVILVDNLSKDKSHINCKNKFPKIILIENKENVGYCEGNNIGIRKSHGKYILILNPDTVLEKDSIKKLLEAFQKYGDGFYQPKLLTTKDKKIINSAGNRYQTFGFGYSHGKGEIDNGQFDQVESIGYSSGACLLTSKEIIEKVGLFDPFLFAYHDDLDLCWKGLLCNIKSYYIPNSIVYHAESFSFQWSPKKFYLLERNRWYCLLTHYSRKTFYKILPFLLIIEIPMILFYLKKGMIKEKIASYRDILKNRTKINSKYNELMSLRTISDKEIVKKFENQIELPKNIFNATSEKIFNSFISKMSKIVKKII